MESALTLEGSRKALGGNAPVMASRFHKEGLTVLLASTVSPELKQEIDKEIKGIIQDHDRKMFSIDPIVCIVSHRIYINWKPFEKCVWCVCIECFLPNWIETVAVIMLRHAS